MKGIRSLHAIPSANKIPPAAIRLGGSGFVVGKIIATARSAKAKDGISGCTVKDCLKNIIESPRERIATGLASGPARRQLIHPIATRLTKEKKIITPRPTATVSPNRRKASARISRKAGGCEEKTEVY